jgi:hypothetical protein
MRKTEIPAYKCHKCPKPAIGRYTPNEEEAGLLFCEEHKDLISVAFYCLIKGNIEDFNALMGTNLNIDEL